MGMVGDDSLNTDGLNAGGLNVDGLNAGGASRKEGNDERSITGK